MYEHCKMVCHIAMLYATDAIFIIEIVFVTYDPILTSLGWIILFIYR